MDATSNYTFESSRKTAKSTVKERERRTINVVKLVSVAIVCMFILTSLGMMGNDNNVAGTPDFVKPITYIDSYNRNDSVTIEYDGIPSSEYNPLYWHGSFGLEEVNNWTAPTSTFDINYQPETTGTITITYDEIVVNSYVEPLESGISSVNIASNTITIVVTSIDDSPKVTFSVTVPMSFSGWNTSQDGSGTNYYPGDVVPDDTLQLYAMWEDTLLWLSGSGTSLKLLPYIEVRTATDMASESSTSMPYTPMTGTPNVYNTEFRILEKIEFKDDKDWYFYPGTIRGSQQWEVWIGNSSSNNYNCHLTGHTIIDNLMISSRNHSINHGDGTRCNLFANGYTLIMGSNMKPFNQNYDILPQIVGGGLWGTRSYDTHVIVHSGLYYNIVGGGVAQTVGNTYLVVRGTTMVVDSITGGSTNNTSGNVNGNTNVYVLGNAYVPGDRYEEDMMGTYRLGSLGSVTITEATVVTGGCSKSVVNGDTHVYLSNSAEVWDVQAGPRRSGGAVTGTVNLEISGKAIVKHLACGGITDGADGNSGHSSSTTDKQVVKHTNIVVKDDAIVRSVFGAGYDTFYEATYSTMYGSESTISITVSGGTVGNIYGGGYRGNVGYVTSTNSPDPIGSVSINILGGTVLENVYGGGRGGLDKILHNTDGTFNAGDSYKNSTGKSFMYADTITIKIDGGVVNGNIYGGGKSVPIITSYNGTTLENGSTAYTNRPDVAHTVCGVLNVVMNGGEVKGNVFGGGEGCNTSDIVTIDGKNYHSSSLITGFKRNASGGVDVVKIPWIAGNQGTTLHEPSDDYENYSYVDADNIVEYINGLFNHVEIGGSIFGGGDRGRVGPSKESVTDNAIDIFIEGDVYIGGSVFGGGKGVEKRTATNITYREIKIDGASIEGNVYGGSRYGTDNAYYVGNTATMSPTKGYCLIEIISGEFSGMSNDIFGGGFMGVSQMDVDIRVGNTVGDEPCINTLNIGSIYGGGSISDVDNSSNQTVLLYGDVVISVGGYDPSTNMDFVITGNVFGQGNNCSNQGTSIAEFINFDQGETKIRSIQKMNKLTIKDSDIRISGSADSSNLKGTVEYSLCHIGELDLVSSNSISYLELNATTFDIHGYNSIYDNTPEHYSNYNHLRINGGHMFTVIGAPDSTDEDMNTISGATWLSTDPDTYYGGFVLACLHSIVDGTIFVLGDGESEGVLTDYSDHILSEMNLRTYHAPGVLNVEETALMENKKVDDVFVNTEFDGTVVYPKTSHDTTVVFAGYYVRAAEHKLDIVNNFDTSSDYLPGERFKVVIGTSDNIRFLQEDGTPYNDGYDISQYQSGQRIESVTNNVRMGFSVECESGFTKSGHVGDVVLHFAELNGNVVVYTFEVTISITLRVEMPVDEQIPLNGTVIVKQSGGIWSGSTDIYLNHVPTNKVARYVYWSSEITYDGTTTDNIPEDVLHMSTVTNYVNRPAWLEGYGREYDVASMQQFDYIGNAAVNSPVLRFEYNDTTIPNSLGSITVVIRVTNDEGGELIDGKTEQFFVITLKFLCAEQISREFKDKHLDENDTIGEGPLKWSNYLSMFSVEVYIGDKLSDYYVAVDCDYLDDNATTASTVEDEANYINEIKNKLVKYTKEIDSVEKSFVLVGTMEKMEADLEYYHYIYDNNSECWYKTEDDVTHYYKIISFTDFMNKYIQNKPNSVFGNEFDYATSSHDWFYTPMNYSRYDFVTPVTMQNVILHAGYRMVLKIDAHYSDGSSANISPNEMLVDDPSKIVIIYNDSDINLGNNISLPEGYEIEKWTSTNDYSADSIDEIEIDGNTTVYLWISVKSYKITLRTGSVDTHSYLSKTMTLYVKNGSDWIVIGTGDTTGDGTGITFEDNRIVKDAEMKITTSLDSGERVAYAHGIRGGGVAMTYDSFTTTGTSAEFVMVGDDVTVNVMIRTNYTVTFQLSSASGSGNNNMLYMYKTTHAVTGNYAILITLNPLEDSVTGKKALEWDNLTGNQQFTISFDVGTFPDSSTRTVTPTIDGVTENNVTSFTYQYITPTFEEENEFGDKVVDISVYIDFKLTSLGGVTTVGSTNDKYQVFNGSKETDELVIGSIVHTDDILIVVANEGYMLDVTFSYDGCVARDNVTDIERTFKVLNTGFVSFGNPTATNAIVLVKVYYAPLNDNPTYNPDDLRPESVVVRYLGDVDGYRNTTAEGSDTGGYFLSATVYLTAGSVYSIFAVSTGFVSETVTFNPIPSTSVVEDNIVNILIVKELEGSVEETIDVIVYTNINGNAIAFDSEGNPFNKNIIFNGKIYAEENDYVIVSITFNDDGTAIVSFTTDTSDPVIVPINDFAGEILIKHNGNSVLIVILLNPTGYAGGYDVNAARLIVHKAT